MIFLIYPSINFFDPRPYWQIILLFSTIQILAILFWGWIVNIFVKNRYKIAKPNYHLFKRIDYQPQSIYNLQQYPQYCLVLVRYNANKTIKSETFYTRLGEWICFDYEKNQRYRETYLVISSYILIVFNFPWILSLLSLIVFDYLQFFFGINLSFFAKYTSMVQKIVCVSFWSSLLSVFLKPN